MFGLRAVRNIEVHAADLRIALPHDPDLSRSLHEDDGFARVEQKAWNAARPATRRWVEREIAGQDPLVVDVHQLSGPGFQNGITGFGNSRHIVVLVFLASLHDRTRPGVAGGPEKCSSVHQYPG